MMKFGLCLTMLRLRLSICIITRSRRWIALLYCYYSYCHNLVLILAPSSDGVVTDELVLDDAAVDVYAEDGADRYTLSSSAPPSLPWSKGISRFRLGRAGLCSAGSVQSRLLRVMLRLRDVRSARTSHTAVSTLFTDP